MIEAFIKYLQFEKRVSHHTSLAYENDLRQFNQFLTDVLSGSKAELADYGMIRSWLVSLVESGLEARSVNRKIACLRTFYKFLLRQEAITKNPMIKIRVLKTSKKLPSFIKESEMTDILDNKAAAETKPSKNPKETEFEKSRNEFIVELFYATGIRLSELISLKESNIDVGDCTIKVLGKRNKERIIPFSRKFVKRIKEYLSIRNQLIDQKNHGLLLVTESGEPCYPMLIYRIVKEKLKAYDSIEKQSPHVLRHTYATHLLNKGAEINAVKDLLGHSSLAATQVYTHNSMEKLKKVFEQAHPKA